jgi:superfamily I DNA/RNA helicase
VVFQYMAAREPFTDRLLRAELLSRFNALDGVDLPEGKLELRPNIRLSLLERKRNRELLTETLTWFRDRWESRGTSWQEARARLQGSKELEELFKQVRMLRLLNATDTLALTLSRAWDGTTAYTDAASAVRRALANDQLTTPEQNTAAVSLMSMHRSKGKEFDGVVIVEGAFHSRLLDFEWDAERMQANHRLLRVAITRARHMVVFVRPEDALPLTPYRRHIGA